MGELFKYIIAPFLICIKAGFKKIREKEKPQDDKKHEEFDKDYQPETFAYRHISEAFIIKPEDPYKDIFRHIKVGFGIFLKNIKNSLKKYIFMYKIP